MDPARSPALAGTPTQLADRVGALLMMDMAHISGLVAAQEAAQVRTLRYVCAYFCAYFSCLVSDGPVFSLVAAQEAAQVGCM